MPSIAFRAQGFVAEIGFEKPANWSPLVLCSCTYGTLSAVVCVCVRLLSPSVVHADVLVLLLLLSVRYPELRLMSVVWSEKTSFSYVLWTEVSEPFQNDGV